MHPMSHKIYHQYDRFDMEVINGRNGQYVHVYCQNNFSGQIKKSQTRQNE